MQWLRFVLMPQELIVHVPAVSPSKYFSLHLAQVQVYSYIFIIAITVVYFCSSEPQFTLLMIYLPYGTYNYNYVID